MQKIAELSVRSSLRMPGRDTERIHLDIQDPSSTNLGRVVLVIEANPIQIEGAIHFDKEATCDFKEYVEGELGIIRLPANKVLRVEFDTDESAWMQATETESITRTGLSGKSYRIVGGWKPNDPPSRWTASGGTDCHLERRWYPQGDLYRPPHKLGITGGENWRDWWCKYNLRGNVKSFEDQITIPNDPAPHHDLLPYLTTVSEDELLNLLGRPVSGRQQTGSASATRRNGILPRGGCRKRSKLRDTTACRNGSTGGTRFPATTIYLAFSKKREFQPRWRRFQKLPKQQGTDHTDYDCRAETSIFWAITMASYRSTILK